MNRYYCIFFFLTVLGCSNKKSLCYKDAITNSKVTDASEDMNQGKADMIFTDSTQLTFVNGKLFAEAKVLWRSCSKYALIVKDAYYTGGVRPGDTAEVNIKAFNKDTFYYVATAYGKSLSGKFVKIK